MVLSLPLPSFAKPSTSPPRPADTSATKQTSRRDRGASSNTSSPSRNGWKPSAWAGNSSPAASSSQSTHSITLSEALRNNPFGSNPSRPHVPQPYDYEAEEQRREQEELNAALESLVRIFPDIRIEVFRELLVRFDGQSRLQVCVEQLLRHKKDWVSGRWNLQHDHDEKDNQDADGAAVDHRGPTTRDGLVPLEERFRAAEYKTAVRAALIKEFGSLNKSTVEAVLAEANFSYPRARPTLRDLSRRTWRATFSGMIPSFKRKKDREEHPCVVWQRRADGELAPRVKDTGCGELDKELHAMLVAPYLRSRQLEQENGDFQIALDLNEKEAQAAGSLFECECCFADVTFEQIATCSANIHIICYNCIQRTTQEALFGQGWGKSVDLEHSTLKCIAPLSVGACDGCLHPHVVRQAILLGTAGCETYRKFEDRLASEVLLKSQLKLIRCPFCSYAEADPVYHPSARGIRWRIRTNGGILPTLTMIVFLLDLVPFLVIPFFVLLILDPASLASIFNNAIRSLCLKIRPKRFTCANPSCQRTSCLTCQKAWRDPHVCHEPLLLDLRATVEAARTAAVKRTCPRCSLSFVKSSGCNKLTCVCGYSMCYLCRKALGPPIKQDLGRHGARRCRPQRLDLFDGAAEDENAEDMLRDDEFEEQEGYKHFCEHFRINPGSRCTECTKCDLYQAEDEELVARRAGEKAEREWLIRQGSNPSSAPPLTLRNINQDLSVGTEGNNQPPRRSSQSLWDIQLGHGKPWSYWFSDVWTEGRWKLEGQSLVNWIVEQVVVVDEI